MTDLISAAYANTCIVCLKPTDTAMAFRGEAEWLIAGLVTLGVPEDQAYGAYRQSENKGDADDLEDGEVRAGVHDMSVRVCAACVRACPAGFPAPALAVSGAVLPTIEAM
jgi:ferredoxin